MKKEIYKYAKKYRSLGLNVLPLANYTKNPAVDSWKQYQDSLASDEEFYKWFKRSDLTGIGVILGKISGIIAVDDDNCGGLKDLKLQSPVTVKTVNNRRHYYFIYSPDIKSAYLKSNIEIRSEGLFIVLPPSEVYKKDGQISAYKFIGVPKFDKLKKLNVSLLPNKTHYDRVDLTEITKPQKGIRHQSLLSIANSLFSRFRPEEWDIAEKFIRDQAEQTNPPYNFRGEKKDLDYIIRDAKNFVSRNKIISKNVNVQSPKKIRDLVPQRLQERALEINALSSIPFNTHSF